MYISHELHVEMTRVDLVSKLFWYNLACWSRINFVLLWVCWDTGKEFACSAGDLSLIPGLGRSPGGGHGNPLQYSCLENPMDRGAWQATVYGVAKSWTRLKRLNMHACLTLCDPMGCSLPGSFVHGIFHARVLEWGAIAFSAESLGKPK